MRLRSLRIERLPGIRPSFELTGLSPEVNVVLGPNASGKSSVLRAVKALLYEDELKGKGVVLEGVFEDDGDEVSVVRVADSISWRRGGRTVDRPSLPAHHLLGCYALTLEELSGAAVADETIVGELQRALAGGYDVRGVLERAPFRLKPSHARSEARALQEADRELDGVQNKQRALREDQARISTWERQEAEAIEAAGRAEDHRKALRLLDAHGEVRRCEEELSRLPAGMERLVGDEGKRADHLRTATERHLGELREAREAEGRAAAALAATRLEPSVLTQTEVAESMSRLTELGRWETEAGSLAVRSADARVARDRADAQLRAKPAGGNALDATAVARELGGGPHLEPATLQAVESRLGQRREVAAEVRSLASELTRLPALAGAQVGSDALRAARDAYLNYLSAPRPPTAWQWAGGLLTLAGAGSALALLAIGTAAWARWAAPGAAAILGLVFLFADRSGRRQRSNAKQELRRSGQEVPADWAPDTVRAALTRTESALARAEHEARRWERRQEVEARLAEGQDHLAGIERELAQVADDVGFDPRHLDASFERWLRLVDESDRAQRDLAQAQARLDSLSHAIDARRGEIVAFLTREGEAPAVPAPDAATLEKRLVALQTRLAQRSDALSELERARSDARRAEELLSSTKEEFRALLVDAALIPEGGAEPQAHDRSERTADELGDPFDEATRKAVNLLRQRLELLPDFRRLRRALSDAQVEVRMRAQDLGQREDLLAVVERGDRVSLERMRDEWQEIADRSREFTQKISATRALIREAAQDRELEHARAKRQAAADALDDRVSEALYARAGSFLLTRVEREYRQDTEPPALRRAAEWFSRFTHSQFELRFNSEAGREAAYAAVDTVTGDERTLDELSSGTRAQLLLAVRVAFALQAEEGRRPLPLFLDEALTTADARRFEEVGRSLAVLARDGRQLFYLTARAEDARLWKALAESRDAKSSDGAILPGGSGATLEVRLVDIARQRRLAEAVSQPEDLAATSPRVLPAPTGRSAEAYAALLGVPAVDPRDAASACHVFHLVRDRLPLLKRLLEAELPRVGPLRSFLQGTAARALLTKEERDLLARRLAGTEAYVDAWRVGRGRLVDRAALEASMLLTDKMLERVDRLGREVHGEARALVEGLMDKRVANLQTKKRDALATWLSEQGYLDERPILTGADVKRRVFAAMANVTASPPNESAALMTEAEQLTRWLDAGVRAGSGARPDKQKTTSEEDEPGAI